jgi:two-component system, cell cycle response regulator DivK
MARRILVVEDDLLNRMFYLATLEQAGFSVASVSDGAEVMREVERFRPELVIMDINLPNVSGIHLIERLKASPEHRLVPILAITAYVGKPEEARIREAGARDYLAKPVSMRQLLSAIERLLEPARS